jgi:hypothetical protein
VSDDPHFGGQGNQSQGDFFHAAPNIDHSQDFVKKDITEWMQWMQSEVGYDGWRLDYVRGFSGTHVKTYMESTNVSFAVGEFWDTLEYDYDSPKYNQDAHRQRIIKWIDDAGGLAGAFDVTTKGILHAVFERQEYWRLSDEDGQPPGVLGRWPFARGDVHREPRHRQHARALEVPGRVRGARVRVHHDAPRHAHRVLGSRVRVARSEFGERHQEAHRVQERVRHPLQVFREHPQG